MAQFWSFNALRQAYPIDILGLLAMAHHQAPSTSSRPLIALIIRFPTFLYLPSSISNQALLIISVMYSTQALASISSIIHPRPTMGSLVSIRQLSASRLAANVQQK